MATAIRTISHEDRLSLVEHLDELRTRLIVAGAALVVAFGVCLWQNHALLHVINRPLDKQTQKQVRQGHGPLGQVAVTQQALLRQGAILQREIDVLARPDSGLGGAARAELAPLSQSFRAALAGIPRTPTGDKPVTLGIGEPFTTTVTISFYFALLFSLPLILYQLYAFLLPAFSPTERRVALPLMLAIPFLFIGGVLFGYFVVLPAAVKFFQNFNSGSFNVLVQANAYYHFAALTLLAMGAIFQVPVGILAAVNAGVVTPKQLRKNRRYAIVIAAVIAALLPGDAVTMLLEAAPLIVLYELSILLASVLFRRVDQDTPADAGAAEPTPEPGEDGVAPIPPIAPPGVTRQGPDDDAV